MSRKERTVSYRCQGVRASVATVATALLMGTTACDSPSEPEPGPVDVGLAFAVASAAWAMAPPVLDPDEPYEHACPSGGRLVVTGTASLDREDGTLVHRWDHVLRLEECAMDLHGNEVVSDGELHLFGESRHGDPVDGYAPLLFQESGQVGSLTTRRDGQSITCDYDLSISYDAAEDDAYRITGTACGRNVDVRAPATPS